MQQPFDDRGQPMGCNRLVCASACICGCHTAKASLTTAVGWESHVGKKLYVGNLAFQVTGTDLGDLFAQYGAVTSAQIIEDRDTGRSKGFWLC